MRFVIDFLVVRAGSSHLLFFQAQSLSRLEQSETDSGCHLQDSDDLVSELQSRLAEMESELRVLREGKPC